MFNYSSFIHISIKTFAAVAMLLTASFSFAGVDTETDDNGVILAGHDVISYFTDNKPVLGKSSMTTTYNGAIYRFSSEKNRDTFIANPSKYAPAYGGFCAYGMTFGKKFEIDGKAFKVVDGVLYVNKNLDVAKAWGKDIPKHLREAYSEWPSIKNIAADKL